MLAPTAMSRDADFAISGVNTFLSPPRRRFAAVLIKDADTMATRCDWQGKGGRALCGNLGAAVG